MARAILILLAGGLLFGAGYLVGINGAGEEQRTPLVPLEGVSGRRANTGSRPDRTQDLPHPPVGETHPHEHPRLPASQDISTTARKVPAAPHPLLLHLEDPRGRTVFEGLGAPVKLAEKKTGVLLPLPALTGAVAARTAGNKEAPRTVHWRVVARSLEGALALLGPALGPFYDLAPGPSAFPESAFIVGAAGKPGHPVKILERGFDQKLRVPVLVLSHRGCGEQGGVALDEEGRLLGLVPPRRLVEKGEHLLPAIPALLARLEPVNQSLEAYRKAWYEGTPEALLAEARQALKEGRARKAVAAFQHFLRLAPDRRQEVREEFLAAYRALLSLAPRASQAHRRLELLHAALQDLPDAASLELDRLRTAQALGLYGEAVAAAEAIYQLEPSLLPARSLLLAALHLAWAKNLANSGRLTDALDVVERGLALGARSAELLLFYGKLLLRRRDYAGAARFFREALALDDGLAGVLGPLIRRADRFTRAPGKVVIDYPPGSRTILARASINGVDGDFIIDTGATGTMVPEALARAAGLDLSSRVPRVRVKTAGNERTLPYTKTRTIQLGDLKLEGLSVTVGDLAGLGNRGLLGMDFLGAFSFENDPKNGRFVIFSRR